MFRAIIYIAAFATGAIVMSFEMLGSRYLNPVSYTHLTLPTNREV